MNDFRGGESQDFFSSYKTLDRISKFNGVKSYIEKHNSDKIAVKKLLSKVEEKKEYILATGEHAAIVRKNNGELEYLELQHPFSKANKFYPLNNKVLRERFGTVSSNKTSTGIKYEKNSYLIDVESLGKNNEFSKLLQFINTPQGMEWKGAHGRVK